MVDVASSGKEILLSKAQSMMCDKFCCGKHYEGAIIGKNKKKRVICLVTCGKKIVHYGINNLRMKNKNFKACSTHAETKAILLSLKKIIHFKGGKRGRKGKKGKLTTAELRRKIKKYKFYVVRVMNNSEEISFGMSKPCKECAELLRNYQIKCLYYSNDKGTFTKVNVCDLISKHMSYAQRTYREEVPTDYMF